MRFTRQPPPSIMNKPVLLKIVFAAVMVSSFFLCLRGVKFGLPSAGQNRLLFSGPEEMGTLIPVMAKRRQEIYSYYATLGALHELHNKVPETRTIAVKLAGRAAAVSEHTLDAMRSFMLHSQLPDEPFTLKIVSQMKHDLNPHFFFYGGGYLYLSGAAYKLSSMLGLITASNDPGYYLSNPAEAAKLYMVPKILSMLIFALSIPLLFILGRELYGPETGLLGSLLYAFTPIITTYTHFNKPHVLLLPMVLISMLAAARLLHSDKKRWYAAAGTFAGLAAGTFYYSGAVILCAVAGHAVKCFSKEPRAGISELLKALAGKNFLILAGSSLAGFFIVNPYWIVDYKSVLQDIGAFVVNHAASTLSMSGLTRYLFATIPDGVGWAAGIMFFGGVFLAFIRRSAQDAMLLFLLIPFVIYAAGGNPDFWHTDLHMSMAIVPAIILLAARFCAQLLINGNLRKAGIAVAVSAVAYTALNSFYYSGIFAGGDNKLKAGAWINENIKPGSSIGAARPFSSAYRGYPPFRQLAYELESGPLPLKKADFYVVAGRTGEKERALLREFYDPEIKFSRRTSVLDRIFTNTIIRFVDEDVEIYRKKQTAGPVRSGRHVS